MADLIQSALASLKGWLPKRTVKYQRGDLEIELEATVARTMLRYTDEHGARRFMEVRDYLIDPSDLIPYVGGDKFEPAEGHRILDSEEGFLGERTYEVSSGGEEEVWRWTDRYHTLLRVHTVEIDEAAI